MAQPASVTGSTEQLALLPVNPNLEFAIQVNGKLAPLRISQWSTDFLIMSHESAKKFQESKVLFRVKIGKQYSRNWEKLEGEVGEYFFRLTSRNSFLESLYKNQGSVLKTLDLKEIPTRFEFPNVWKFFRRLLATVSIILLISFLISLVGYRTYQGEFLRDTEKLEVQTRDLQKASDNGRIRVSGHSKRIASLEGEITRISALVELSFTNLEKSKDLLKKGVVVNKDFEAALLQHEQFSLQVSERTREAERLRDELQADQALREELASLKLQTGLKKELTYFQWVRSYFIWFPSVWW